MARLNLEDEYFDEIPLVAVKVGDLDKAHGNAVRFFRYAQQKHKHGKYITEEEFKEQGFLEALFPQFAIRTENGIMARGAEKHFGWLRKRIEAGRKGGSKPKQTEANESKHEQVEPSSSYSYSYSKEETTNSAVVKPRARKKRKVSFETSTQLREAVADCFTSWKEIYPDQKYLERELLKAFLYYSETNKRKKPTTLDGWKRALGSWFDRGWAKHVASIPNNKSSTSTKEYSFADSE